ncbi:hypothetical protein O6H91_12G021200 [Diphasiastrum complanatum]|uniref:Uncharacterized protein n=3 Tax=Diphasiastrum complanatum TaxID=34168 RepID=A0ACC2BZG0_DIPCM|nr:hypothetical protein O6H91_12G021200 [Diphasiastrum complanatum]KAJ7535159.1 hypothetical protein O6H91_12G021200 [Diphasiastrum complanatum]KAJ7535160.1 hypothetical protein O6H91_12G021200 [Diphasiastrum complanatum]
MFALRRLANRHARHRTVLSLLQHVNSSPQSTDKVVEGFSQLKLSAPRLFATKEGSSEGKASKLLDGSKQRKTKKKERFGTYDNDFEDELDDMPHEEGIDHLYDARSIVEEWMGDPTFFGMIAEDALSSGETSKDGPPGEGPILRWETRLVLGPGGDGWHPANRKVKVSVYVKELELSKKAKERLLALVGKRYNPRKDELTIVSERYSHREENRKDVLRTLYALIEEANKADEIATPV